MLVRAKSHQDHGNGKWIRQPRLLDSTETKGVSHIKRSRCVARQVKLGTNQCALSGSARCATLRLRLIGYSPLFHLTILCYAPFVIQRDGPVGAESDLVRLGALLDQTELAVVVEGSQFDAGQRRGNRVLARVDDSAGLAELGSALRCIPGSPRLALMAPGEPTIALFAAERRYLAAITLVGWGHVRSPGLLEGDVLLAGPARFVRWLAVTGGWGKDIKSS